MSHQIYGSFVTATRYFTRLNRNIYTSRSLCGTHYDTLKLPRNCTTKDVRDSFIKLSKQCHPDKNQNDPNTHAQFVKLNEAYHILSRPDKRRAYDLTLHPMPIYRPRNASRPTPFDVYTTAYRQRVVWRDETFWEYQDKTAYNNNSNRDFYGIKGLRRVSNGMIALLCVAFSIVGVWIQVILIRQSTTFNRKNMDDRSERVSKILAEVQEQAVTLGNKTQLERMAMRMRDSQTETMSSDNKATPDAKQPQKTSGTSESNRATITVFSENKATPDAKQPQKTPDISEPKRATKNVVQPRNTAAPSVVVLPDAGPQGFAVKNHLIQSREGILGTVPHNLQKESENGIIEPKIDLIVSSNIRGKYADIIAEPHNLPNLTQLEKESTSILTMQNTNVITPSTNVDIIAFDGNSEVTSSLQNVDTTNTLLNKLYTETLDGGNSSILPVQNFHELPEISIQDPVPVSSNDGAKTCLFEITLGNGYDIKVTNHQNQTLEEKQEENLESRSSPETIVMPEREVFCEMPIKNNHVPDDLLSYTETKLSSIDAEQLTTSIS